MNSKLVITSSSDLSSTINVEGRDVLITGQDREIHLSGHCKDLRIIGEGHRVFAETVDTISIQGSQNHIQICCLGFAKLRGEDNTLEWRQAANGRLSPRFNIDGDGNTVSMLT